MVLKTTGRQKEGGNLAVLFIASLRIFSGFIVPPQYFGYDLCIPQGQVSFAHSSRITPFGPC